MFCRYRVTTLVLLVALGGCAQTQNWLGDHGIPGFAGGNSVEVNTESIIAELDVLVTGGPTIQTKIHSDAKTTATSNPTSLTKLRYALVLATPGHASTDVHTARDLLNEILAQPETLTATQTSLAKLYVADIENSIRLESELATLREDRLREITVTNKETAFRLESAEDENRRLRQSLSEAEKKLDAITSIERSMRERSDQEQ